MYSGFFMASATCVAQMSIQNTRELDVSTAEMWGYARFNPDGSRILFSTLSYDGIWSYEVTSGNVTEITRDEGSGFGFAVSPDGKTIAYRRTHRGKRWIDKSQEIVVQDLHNGSVDVIGSARTVSPPVYHNQDLSYAVGNELLPAPPKMSGIFLQGVIGQKIVILVNGDRKVLDPIGNGSYIWPSLSPDRRSILAYDMDNGAFISSVDGILERRLGRAEAPVWTRDGDWIVYFSEQNDGYRITGGDLHALHKDGTRQTRLTSTESVVELFPSVSPVDNTIVCHTLDGKILLMTYNIDE
jgi:Tol biopolymer transport system component